MFITLIMVLMKLRQSTKPLHDRLEKRLNILQSPPDAVRYLRILKRFYGFYQPLERQHPAYQECPDQWIGGDRRKLRLLHSDLNDASLSDFEIGALPVCNHLPPLHNQAQQMGCMYVLEGATLGGQVVLRHLQNAFEGKVASCSFFASYGDLVGQRWRSFCAHLEQLVASDFCSEAIITSACETFAAMDRWLFAEGGL